MIKTLIIYAEITYDNNVDEAEDIVTTMRVTVENVYTSAGVQKMDIVSDTKFDS